MNKTTAKGKNNKKNEKLLVPDIDLEEEVEGEQPAASELDPEILKVLTKPKKPKNAIYATDYVPELERGDTDEEFGSTDSGF